MTTTSRPTTPRPRAPRAARPPPGPTATRPRSPSSTSVRSATQGWTKKHDDGRKQLEEELGDDVETTFLENVQEGASSEAVFERLAREGNEVIFGTSFGYGDQMLAVAEKYPDVVFEHATGYQVAENMGTYFGAAEEARYLSGMAAGAMTESNEIGYVAAFPIPEVLRGHQRLHPRRQAGEPRRRGERGRGPPPGSTP
jgi:hypothetical protein